MKAIVVLLAIVCVCMAAVQRKKATIDRNNPGKCIEDGIAYEPNENWDMVRRCARGTCYSSSASLFVSIAGCGSIGVRPGCRRTEIDYSKPYPDCCPNEDCT